MLYTFASEVLFLVLLLFLLHSFTVFFSHFHSLLCLFVYLFKTLFLLQLNLFFIQIYLCQYFLFKFYLCILASSFLYPPSWIKIFFYSVTFFIKISYLFWFFYTDFFIFVVYFKLFISVSFISHFYISSYSYY